MVRIIFLLFLAFILLNIVWYSWKSGITPTPTSKQVKAVLAQLLPSRLEDGPILELGSGWGSLIFTLAEHYPNRKIKGYEISPIPYVVSRLRTYFEKEKNVSLHRKDFFKISLGEAALVVCYLYPGAMQQLKDKFEKELKPGSFILSHTFSIPGWKPIQTIYAKDLYRTPVFLYQKPYIEEILR